MDIVTVEVINNDVDVGDDSQHYGLLGHDDDDKEHE